MTAITRPPGRRHLTATPRPRGRRHLTATRRRRWRVCALLVVVTAPLAGCVSGSGAFSGPPPLRAGRPVTYVSVSEQVPSTVTDPRRSWQDLFERAALPYWTTSYVVPVPDDWQIDPAALTRQVALLRPTVVTVDVGFEEALEEEGVAAVSDAVRQLLTGLESKHVRTILVANLPPAPRQPGRLPTATEVASYDSAIAADCDAAGAVLVDVHGVLAHAAGQAVSRTGMLTALGEKLVAGAFEKAIRRRPLS